MIKLSGIYQIKNIVNDQILTWHHYWYFHEKLMDGCLICEDLKKDLEKETKQCLNS
jgi:hypothetical protein